MYDSTSYHSTSQWISYIYHVTYHHKNTPPLTKITINHQDFLITRVRRICHRLLTKRILQTINSKILVSIPLIINSPCHRRSAEPNKKSLEPHSSIFRMQERDGIQGSSTHPNREINRGKVETCPPSTLGMLPSWGQGKPGA